MTGGTVAEGQNGWTSPAMVACIATSGGGSNKFQV
jgi:hypothetical protein